MTISSSYAPVSYTANGSQTNFTVSFPFSIASDLLVYNDDVLQAINTDYTITGGGGIGSSPATGTVIFGTAPIDTNIILIKRNISRTQTSDYVDNSKLPANTLEYNLDRLTMMIQELEFRLSELE